MGLTPDIMMPRAMRGCAIRDFKMDRPLWMVAQRRGNAAAALHLTASAIPVGVQPRLEHAVGELARVPPPAGPLAVVGAGGAAVAVGAGVPALGLLPRVGERALRPVMAAPASAPPHLELEHAELVVRVAVRHALRPTIIAVIVAVIAIAILIVIATGLLDRSLRATVGCSTGLSVRVDQLVGVKLGAGVEGVKGGFK